MREISGRLWRQERSASWKLESSRTTHSSSPMLSTSGSREWPILPPRSSWGQRWRAMAATRLAVVVFPFEPVMPQIFPLQYLKKRFISVSRATPASRHFCFAKVPKPFGHKTPHKLDGGQCLRYNPIFKIPNPNHASFNLILFNYFSRFPSLEDSNPDLILLSSLNDIKETVKP